MRNAFLLALWLASMFLAAPSVAIALEVNESDVMAGVNAARDRLVQHVDSFDSSIDTTNLERLIVKSFIDYEEEPDWDGRAVSFVAEIIAVGALSRMHYDEPQLRYEEILGFLPVVSNFINSWKLQGLH